MATGITYYTTPSGVGGALLQRFRGLSAERRRAFQRAHLAAVDALLRQRGRAELSAMMPRNTGRLARSIKPFLRSDMVYVRMWFYGRLNQRSLAALRRWAASGLPALVRDAADLAARTF